ncbi:MAG: hypothetical protein ACRD1U_01620, partial [Vicinamibacterales bacterium]
MALVLAIEPDSRQGGLLKHIVGDLVGAELVLVESRESAIAAIDQRIPDVILVTALLSPRDEDELVAHLRGLAGAEHLQTHTIPLLSGSAAVKGGRARGSGLLGKFRRKKEADAPVAGCAPEIFADEIRTFVMRAAERKAETVAAIARAEIELEEDLEDSQRRGRIARHEAFSATERHDSTTTETTSGSAGESTWADPFAWRSSYSAPAATPAAPAPVAAQDPEDEPAFDAAGIQGVDEHQSEAERLRLEALEAEAAAERERAERLRHEAEEHRLEAERLRAEAEAAAERALHESLRRQEAEAEAEAAERERLEDMRRLQAQAAAAAERAREEERARLEAEGAIAAAVERAREEERARLEAAAATAAEHARAEERRRVEAEAAAAAARAHEEERARLAAEAASAAEHAREEERARLTEIAAAAA